MESQHKELLTGYMHDVWNNDELSKMRHYVSNDCVCHDPYETDICGLTDAITWVKQMRSSFGDNQVRIEDTVEEGDFIATRLRHTGKHVGEFAGRKPTNSDIVNSAMALWRIEDGQIREVWQHWDALGVSHQETVNKTV